MWFHIYINLSVAWMTMEHYFRHILTFSISTEVIRNIKVDTLLAFNILLCVWTHFCKQQQTISHSIFALFKYWWFFLNILITVSDRSICCRSCCSLRSASLFCCSSLSLCRRTLSSLSFCCSSCCFRRTSWCRCSCLRSSASCAARRCCSFCCSYADFTRSTRASAGATWGKNRRVRASQWETERRRS